MQEAIIFQRRNRLKRHYVNTSNVLLYGYTSISDAAKITYQIIDGFDWEDKETGDSKGYVFPAVETLARIRNTSIRTVQRHIKELEETNLLTRQRRRNKPSILFIEDVSEVEVKKYTENFIDKSVNFEAKKSRSDKNVVCIYR
jgi:DNA-binding MarR family transcriptional regulator